MVGFAAEHYQLSILNPGSFRHSESAKHVEYMTVADLALPTRLSCHVSSLIVPIKCMEGQVHTYVEYSTPASSGYRTNQLVSWLQEGFSGFAELALCMIET